MFRKLLLASSAFVLLAGCAPPAAAAGLFHLKARHAGAAGGNCPQGTADPFDGCPAVAAGSIQFPNLLTPGAAGNAFQTGQTPFSSRPLATVDTVALPGDVASNEAFVDYRDGPNPPPGGVYKDPLVAANWVQPQAGHPFDGCGGIDHTTYWVVECNGALQDFTWQYFDFRANPARTTAMGSPTTNTGPVFVQFDNGNTSANQTFLDNEWGLDGNCGDGQSAFISQQSLVSTNFKVWRQHFDGNFPACKFSLKHGLSLNTTGNQDIQHNDYDHIPGRAATGLQGVGATIIFDHNIMFNCETNPQQGHSECEVWEPVSGAGGPREIRYNTVVLGADTFNGYTSTFYDVGLGPGTLTSSVNDHNVVVVNRVGGGLPTSPISGSIIGKITDDAGGAGNIFEVTVDPGSPWPIFPGTAFFNGGLQANVMEHVAGSPATGVGSKWRLECIYGGCQDSGAEQAAPAGPPYFGLDIPHLNLAAATYTWDNSVTSAAGFEFGETYSGQITFKKNFIDKTGDAFNRSFVMQSGSCGALTIFKGNKNLLSGTSIDNWDTNNATGCQKAP